MYNYHKQNESQVLTDGQLVLINVNVQQQRKWFATLQAVKFSNLA